MPGIEYRKETFRYDAEVDELHLTSFIKIEDTHFAFAASIRDNEQENQKRKWRKDTWLVLQV